MGKLEIREDCLAPEKFIYLTYKGADPWGVAGKISDAIRPFFHVSASGTNNTRINWDISGDPITFFVQWWVKREFSRFTKMRIYMKVQGAQKKTANTGEFTMQLYGNLETSFEGFGLFLKPIWYMYSYLFYNRARRKFLEKCRENIETFRNEIKEHFELETTEIGPPRTAIK